MSHEFFKLSYKIKMTKLQDLFLSVYIFRDAPESRFRYPAGYRIGRIVKKLSGRIVTM